MFATNVSKLEFNKETQMNLFQIQNQVELNMRVKIFGLVRLSTFGCTKGLSLKQF